LSLETHWAKQKVSVPGKKTAKHQSMKCPSEEKKKEIFDQLFVQIDLSKNPITYREVIAGRSVQWQNLWKMEGSVMDSLTNSYISTE